MQVKIPVSRVLIQGGYVLDFDVDDSNTIKATLYIDRDPTLIDTNQIQIATQSFWRSGELEEHSHELVSTESNQEFVSHTFQDALAWAHGEVEEHAVAQEVAELLTAAILDAKLPQGTR